ncbi:hypothetical protein C8F01DRAFT_1164491 [Mycena amicta]|nr:hypothetical protein C8F01DRAFT_1164491 [Mycena amicta]
MAPPSPPTDTVDTSELPSGGKNKWTEDDETKLIRLLSEPDRRAKGGDNMHFTDTVFADVAKHLNLTRTAGSPKTVSSCRLKWNALRKIYGLVHHIKGMSGWHWDDRTGVSISDASQGTWDAWVALNPDAAKFRNKGWPHYDGMASLMPTVARGQHVFRSGRKKQPAPSRNRESSPDWDIGQMEKDLAQGTGEMSDDDDPPQRQRQQNNDDEDDEEEDEAGRGPIGNSSSSPAPTRTKRVAAQPAGSVKRQRSSGANSLSKVADAVGTFNGIMEDFNDTLKSWAPAAATAPTAATVPTASTFSSAAPDPSHLGTPHRRKLAIKQAQKETWLTIPDRVTLVQLLSKQGNVVKADTYMDLEDEMMRVAWVIAELREISVFVTHPQYPELSFSQSFGDY